MRTIIGYDHDALPRWLSRNTHDAMMWWDMQVMSESELIWYLDQG